MSNDIKVSAARVFGNPVMFLAFGFGSGLAPKAPGTAGTLAAVPLYWWLSHYPPALYISLVILISVSGIWICQRASDMLGVHDHGGIVWDEIAGYLLTMIAAPPGWQWMLAGFALFRVLDIFKPWPISWADEKVHGGLGVMLDDLIAGGLAAVILLMAGTLLRG